ncbi:NAD(P)-binding protein [Karstenula rhodostoma CBS 690.94]|uniref:NAD(P)-binding protein n=1 Tax=Karstenula rhodostoma CBS 690.94 TaxID=1392251 RepID=A0A9P4UED0_9PLEO|nr:NAD(P)-binding protein [Karstenula rhodostoma CBS 690.94]
MTPSFLIVGATGNTGRKVVETLSKHLKTDQTFSGYRIIAATRSAKSPAAQKLAQLPGVEIGELSWVTRAFIASHNLPNQFAEESTFHVAALTAGVKYVVRISTTAAKVHPNYPAYYPRTHWAIEAMLSSPEFSAMQWTSLQPNVFSTLYLSPAVELIKKEGKQDVLRLLANEDTPCGIIDPDDVGIVAGHFLLQEDSSLHNKAKYVLNGPEDITGCHIVKMVEEEIGTSVENVSFKDVSFIEQLAAASKESKSVMLSIKHAVDTNWAGKCTASTTSKLDLAAPKGTPAEVFKTMLEE